jgi:hypothetical protein
MTDRRRAKVDADKLPTAYKTAQIFVDITHRALLGETYASIGASYGISRQRVENIIQRLYVNR